MSRSSTAPPRRANSEKSEHKAVQLRMRFASRIAQASIMYYAVMYTAQVFPSVNVVYTLCAAQLAHLLHTAC